MCRRVGEKSFADFAGGHFVAFFPPPRWDLPWRVAVVSQRERSARKRELNLVHAFFRHVKENAFRSFFFACLAPSRWNILRTARLVPMA